MRKSKTNRRRRAAPRFGSRLQLAARVRGSDDGSSEHTDTAAHLGGNKCGASRRKAHSSDCPAHHVCTQPIVARTAPHNTTRGAQRRRARARRGAARPRHAARLAAALPTRSLRLVLGLVGVALFLLLFFFFFDSRKRAFSSLACSNARALASGELVGVDRNLECRQQR